MRRKYLQLAGALAAILAGATGYAWVGVRSFEAYRAANATFAMPCGSQITWSPPTNVYTAFYPNLPSLLSVRYRSSPPAMLHIAIDIPELTGVEGVDAQATPSFQSLAFKPTLLGSGALDALVGPRQRVGQIHLRVQSGERALCDTTAPVTLYSRQVMRWYDPAVGDTADYLAGWVTPQADVIRDLTGQAATWLEQRPAEYTHASALHGYDAGRASAADVRDQVNTLFDTLHNVYHLHYAQDNVPYGADASQLVQLPRDILASAAPTGMCVETTVILASAIERLGMRPFVVIVPGHAFLGVALGADQGASIEYWETSDLNGGVSGSQANVHGNAEFADAQARRNVLRVIDIGAERQRGILPME